MPLWAHLPVRAPPQECAVLSWPWRHLLAVNDLHVDRKSAGPDGPLLCVRGRRRREGWKKEI